MWEYATTMSPLILDLVILSLVHIGNVSFQELFRCSSHTRQTAISIPAGPSYVHMFHQNKFLPKAILQRRRTCTRSLALPMRIVIG